MKWLSLSSLLLIATLAYAQETTSNIPEWYSNPPTSTKKFYGIGSGTSKSLEIAEQKAVLQANLCIAEQAEPVKVKEIKKKTTSLNGKTQEEAVQQKIVSAELSGVRVVKKEHTHIGDEFTVYVLLEMKKRR